MPARTTCESATIDQFESLTAHLAVELRILAKLREHDEGALRVPDVVEVLLARLVERLVDHRVKVVINHLVPTKRESVYYRGAIVWEQ